MSSCHKNNTERKTRRKDGPRGSWSSARTSNSVISDGKFFLPQNKAADIVGLLINGQGFRTFFFFFFFFQKKKEKSDTKSEEAYLPKAVTLFYGIFIWENVRVHNMVRCMHIVLWICQQASYDPFFRQKTEKKTAQ